MIYKNWEQLIGDVKNFPKSKRVAVAAAEDMHTLEAVFHAVEDGLVKPVLVGDSDKIKKFLASLNKNEEDAEIYDEPDRAKAAYLAVKLIKEGKADFLMKGMLDTAELLKAVVDKEYGLGTGQVMSHVAIQKIPAYHKMLITTDGGMILYPTLEQKKAIIENAVQLLTSLGYTKPKVAVLAGVEKINPKMPETLDAATLKEMSLNGEIKNCIVEGPISLDLALVSERSEVKGYRSEVAGDADILVSPDMTTSNILGKSFVEMAGAKMAGLIMGAKVPVIVTSRGSSSEEKYLALALAAACVA